MEDRCSFCGAELFLYRGKKYCPNCSMKSDIDSNGDKEVDYIG
jgi:uncharacterized Zn finger protein (UPF0148 family)